MHAHLHSFTKPSCMCGCTGRHMHVDSPVHALHRQSWRLTCTCTLGHARKCTYSFTCMCAHACIACTHARARARTHACARTHTHTGLAEQYFLVNKCSLLLDIVSFWGTALIRIIVALGLYWCQLDTDFIQDDSHHSSKVSSMFHVRSALFAMKYQEFVSSCII